MRRIDLVTTPGFGNGNIRKHSDLVWIDQKYRWVPRLGFVHQDRQMAPKNKIWLTFDQCCEMLRNQITDFDRLFHMDIDWGAAMTKRDKKIYENMNNTCECIDMQWCDQSEDIIWHDDRSLYCTCQCINMNNVVNNNLVYEDYLWMHWYEWRQCDQLSPSRCTWPKPVPPPGIPQTCPGNSYFQHILI